MSADPLAELAQILDEERKAIRRLDAPAVLAFARRKEALITALPDPLPPAEHARLRALVPSLRQNGVLLAHARGMLRDALKIAWPRAQGGTSAPTPAAGPLLSVRG